MTVIGSGFQVEIDREILTSILDLAPFGIALANEEGTAVSASKGFHKIMRTKDSGFEGSSLREIFGRGGISWDDVAANPESDMIRTYEKPGVHKRTLSIRSARISIGDGKSLISVYVSDISRRQRVERALRESETRARGFFEQDLIGMARMSAEGAYLEVNDTLCGFTGFSRDELINMDQYVLYAGNPEELRKFFGKLTGGGPGTGVKEIDLRKKDGTVCPFRVYFGSEKVPGNRSGAVVALYEDIGNERASAREAEERRQQLIRAERMATLGTLVSGTAHEISNPNQIIMANAELAQIAWQTIGKDDAGESDSGQPGAVAVKGMKRYLSRITEGARRIDRIVEDMKAYVRDAEAPFPSRMSLNEAAIRAASLLDRTIEKATDHFILDLDPGLPEVSANLGRIEQVAVNFIMNACQALRNKDESLCIRTRREGNFAVLEVRDDGRGIPEEDLEKISEPFFTSRRNEGGTGLGLAVAEGIAGDYGGRLVFSPSEGGGTVAGLLLPILDY